MFRIKIRGITRQFGQSTSQYLGTTILIAIATIGVVGLFGDSLQTQFGNLAREITGSSEQSKESSSSSAELLEAFDGNDQDTSEENVAVNSNCPLGGTWGCAGRSVGGGTGGVPNWAGGSGASSSRSAPVPAPRGPANNPSSSDAARAGRTQPYSSTHAQFPANPSQSSHIFRDAPGHLRDTPANRRLLIDVANNPANRLGTDRFGNVWSATTRADGTQV